MGTWESGRAARRAGPLTAAARPLPYAHSLRSFPTATPCFRYGRLDADEGAKDPSPKIVVYRDQKWPTTVKGVIGLKNATGE